MSWSIPREVQVVVLLSATFASSFAVEKSSDESRASIEAKQEVQAALRAEAAGENLRREELLASALRRAPHLAEANWHLARVQDGGRWQALAELEQRAAKDSKLTEYRKLRDDAQDKPHLVRGLARWCMKAGLEENARLYYSLLLCQTNIDEGAWKEAVKQLDLHLVGGEWLTGEQLKEQQERARAIDSALRQWRTRLKKLQLAIDGIDYAARKPAIKELSEIDDPQSICALESFQLDGGDRFCEEAVKRLASFPQIEATEALMRFAVLSPFSAARECAIDALKERPKHDYVPLLMSGLIEPIKSQYAIAAGRNGAIHYTHAIQQENAGRRVVSVASQTAFPATVGLRTGVLALGRITKSAFAQTQLFLAQQAATEIENRKEMVNFQVTESNRQLFEALEGITELQLDRQPSQWWAWWQQYNEYEWPKPTYFAYQHTPAVYFGGTRATSCFVAGTLVRAQTGLAPIESLQAGDRVLAQEQDTGELAYKLVLRTTLRPSAKTVRIKTADDEIVSTLGHPFWLVGHGWKMAKELAAGDLVHSLRGAVRIENVEPAGENQAYNLVVDDFNTYFVGEGLLVHDNEFRKPTRAIVPGLMEEPAAAAKP